MKTAVIGGGASAVSCAAAIVLAGCGGTAAPPPDATTSTTPVTTEVSTPEPAGSAGFTLSSPAFAANTPIPAEYSCTGRNVAPPLQWRDVPAGTASLALVVDDPDAPAGRFVHWVVTGIPASELAIVDGGLPAAAVISLNSAGQPQYLGPCPPAGTGVHHYRFTLHALREALTLRPDTPVAESTAAIDGRSVAVADTVGVFGG